MMQFEGMRFVVMLDIVILTYEGKWSFALYAEDSQYHLSADVYSFSSLSS